MTVEEAVPIFGVLVPLLGGVDFLVRKYVAKMRDEMVVALNAQIKTLHREKGYLAADLNATRAELTAAKQLLSATASELAAERAARTRLQEEAADRDAQLLELTELKQALDAQQKTRQPDRSRT